MIPLIYIGANLFNAMPRHGLMAGDFVSIVIDGVPHASIVVEVKKGRTVDIIKIMSYHKDGWKTLDINTGYNVYFRYRDWKRDETPDTEDFEEIEI